jgi:UDP-N-acetylmuramoyl-L-alanyl-D-glutamate--2,6-diaminopimelate ligase
MTLRELIAGAGLDLLLPSQTGQGPRVDVAESEQEVEVTALAYRSEGVATGALFFCVPGFRADGHDFAPDAVARGAVALVCERSLRLGVPELVVDNVRAAMAPLAAAFYRQPTTELEVVGVTGTNGKTTTSFLVRDILEAAGRQTGLLGTVHSVVGRSVEEVERTTPEAVDLQRTFRRMVDAGDTACVMEVSSHALELHRADAIHFDCAVFTNLTQDHLDFHGTLEDYFGAKRRLFFAAMSPPPRVPVINVDDDWGRRLTEELVEAGNTETITFGLDREADYRAERVEYDAVGSSFVCRAPQREIEVRVPLPGLFNVYNALAALAACCALGVDLEVGANAVAGAGQVPGRFESIDEGQGFTVLVDYAHTPDSLANVLRASRELLGQHGQSGGGGRLICVFGAGGDRDRDKRPMMGEVARQLADHVIVTSDNPRSEDPQAIIAAIVEGAERAAVELGAASALEVEPDRGTAIARAVRLARASDIVVIAGKGHEQGQEFADARKIPFDDREVARRELRALGTSKARPAA